jgi:hypothetical protein
MGLWTEILKLGAQGKSLEARALIALDLRQALCRLAPLQEGSRYRGPLPLAVQRFCAKLPEQERVLVQAWEQEFTEYLLDDILNGVAKPLQLIELCRSFPQADLVDWAELFPWEAGLKRDRQWKENWVADHLRSLLAVGIPLPLSVSARVGERGAAKYEFNEIAFAIAPERLRLGWKNFKEQQGLWAQLQALQESAQGEGVAAEAVDYGVIPLAELAACEITTDELELEIDLRQLGQQLSGELHELLEALHALKPGEGYRPVAWHNVFWNLLSEYVRLRLNLEIRDPLLETDNALASYLKGHYPEVRSLSRLSVMRRRQTLSAACAARIEAGFWAKFSPRAEQPRAAITHASEDLN